MNSAAALKVQVVVDTGRALKDLTLFDTKLKASAASADDVTKNYDKTSKSIRDGDKDVRRSTESWSSFSKKVITANQTLGLLRKSTALIKWPAMIAGAGYAAEGLSAAAGGATALVSALTPLSGLLASAGSGMVAMGQVQAVVMLSGMKEVTSAVGGLNTKLDEQADAFKQLSPQAQDFARTLEGMKKPLLDLQESIQKPLFRGLTAGLKEAKGALPAVQTILKGTARAMAGIAKEVGGFLGSKQFSSDLLKIGKTNNSVLGRLGGVAVNLGKAFMDVLVAVRPLTVWVGRLVDNWSQAAKKAADLNRANGDMARFFNQTKDVAQSLIHIGKSLGAVFITIGKASAPLGRLIIDKLEQGATLLKEWVTSTAGKKGIAEFFKQIKPPLWAAGKLLVDIGKAFFEIQNQVSGALTPMIKQIDNELLPIIVDVITETTKAFGPRLVNMFVSLAKAVGSLAGTSGPLNIWVDTITKLLDAFNWLIEHVPGLQTALATLMGYKAISAAMNFSGAKAALEGLTAKFVGLGATAEATAAQVKASETAMATGAGKGVYGLPLPGAGQTGKTPPIPSTLKTWGAKVGAYMTKVGARSGTALMGGVAANIVGSNIGGEVGDKFEKIGTAAAVGFALAGPWGAAGGAIAGVVVDGFIQRAKADSKDIQEALLGFSAGGGGANDTSMMDTIWGEGGLDQGKLDEVRSVVNDITSFASGGFLQPFDTEAMDTAQGLSAQMKQIGELGFDISKEQANTLRSTAGTLDLSEDQEKSFNRLVRLARQRAIAERQVGIEVDSTNLAAIGSLNQGMGALKSGKLAGGDILDVLKRNQEQIRKITEGSGKDYRKATAKNYMAGADAIEKAMDAGLISEKKGLAKQKELLRKAHLADPTIKQARQFGQAWAKGFDRSSEITKKGVDKLLQKMGKLPPGMQKIAQQATMKRLKEARRAGKIEPEEYGKLVSALIAKFGPLPKKTKDVFGDMWKGANDKTKQGADKTKKTNDSLWSDLWKTTKDGAKKTNDTIFGFSKKASKDVDAFSKNAKGSVDAVGGALDTLKNNVNAALKGMGVKKTVGWSISKVGKTAAKGKQQGGLVKAMKGALVPGVGTGDTVPLHVGGEHIADVEPNEYVGVMNRRAVPDFLAANSKKKRFGLQEGGVIEQALGPYTIPPIMYDPNHAGGNSHIHADFFTKGQAIAYGHKMQGMGWTIGEYSGNVAGFGPVTVQHQSPGHYDGTAFDANSADESRSAVAAVARLFGSGKVTAGVAEKIKRMLLEGPDGPMKVLGQAALDKSVQAANELIQKLAPSGVGGGVSGDGDVERIFAKTAKMLSTSKTATLALGEAGYAESGMTDLAGGDSSSEGALQLLSSTASGMGIDPHDEGAVASAFLLRGYFGQGGANKLADSGLPAHLVAQGVQGSAFSSGSNYAAQEGAAKSWMGRYGLQRGGVLDLNLTKLVRKLRASGPTKGDAEKKYDDAKHDKKIAEGVRDKLRKIIDGKKFPVKGGALAGELKKTRAQADQYGEYASYANRIGDFRGLTEAEWMKKELITLLHLRNQVIRADEQVNRGEHAVHKVGTDAKRRLKGYEDKITKAERVDGHAPKDWKDLDPTKVDIEKWNKIKDDKRGKLKRQFEKDGGKLPGDRTWGSQGKLNESPLDDWRQVASFLKSTVIGTLTGSGGVESVLKSSSRTLQEELKTIQGTGMSGRELKVADVFDKVGKLGGEVLDLQLSLDEIAKASGPQVLDISGLRDVIEAARYGVFDGLPKFHGGGVVPGRAGQEVPIMAQAGETVSNGQPPEVIVNVTNEISFDGLEATIDTKINGKLVKRERLEQRHARQYAR